MGETFARVEWRRKRTPEQKVKILTEALEPGATLSQWIASNGAVSFPAWCARLALPNGDARALAVNPASDAERPVTLLGPDASAAPPKASAEINVAIATAWTAPKHVYGL